MDDVRWLSYEEAADALAITLDSARVISRRKRWPRRKGNDRKTRIGVPENLISSRNLSANGSENSSQISSQACSATCSETEASTVPLHGAELQQAHLAIARLEARVEALQSILDTERRLFADALSEARSERAALRQEMVQERAAQSKALADLVEALRRDREATKPHRWWPWKRSA
jgi:hypothetical protein